MELERDIFENARQSRDPRFDGRFFVGVTTTGIYCRPVCPVRIPKKENVQLYKSAASAAAAGFRPCLRCRPESSPGTPAWSGSSWKVSRALQLIEQGFLDESGVEELAGQLDVGSRQLGRLFQNHLGASPIEVAQTRRLHFAKKLIDETEMPLAEICFASGFGSIRRFNAVFDKTYQRPPREFLEKAGKGKDRGKEKLGANSEQKGIEIFLSYRPPYDWKAILEFLAYRAIPGVEFVSADSYMRTISIEDVDGHFRAKFIPDKNQLKVNIFISDTRHLYHIIDRVKSIFDLRADSANIESFLSKNKLLRPMLKQFSGLRVPGCWSGFEVAVRAILGQQITVKAASTLVSRIAQRYGRSYAHADRDCEALTHIFPDSKKLSDADLAGMGIVQNRIEAIGEVARQIDKDELVIDCTVASDDFVKKTCEIKGIGEWTALYIAMRALNDPDAFPYSDLILRRAAAAPGETLSPAKLRELSKKWQPWRAYVVILLWRHYKASQEKE
jgi:AraC family transcriptional regulator, regulatory protein of adaptative response / DNA-3-methyladenine glycosylase II